jgi:chromosome segregation ATPase
LLKIVGWAWAFALQSPERTVEIDLVRQLEQIGDSRLENIDGNVKVIAEGQGAIVDRLDRVEHRLEILEVKVDKLDVRVGALEVRIEGMDRRLVRVEERLDGMDAQLVRVEERLDGVDGRLVRVEEGLVRVEVRLDGVDRRLVRVEERLDLDPPPRAKRRPTKKRAA